ncbi:hypothetical protein MIND_00131100 [Mycena indigotica]|uniref:Uncharacterized protein n=1 Tax=Mycena indigotica TaxID=2126181 RepID=A0A8H6TC80_9AGAR|nr:uncharacterized protein MIND_00131100 [Mycena indigotica]KAF7316130.1 hypothetical protein MIND_00131100 [Mycena indigotica]
MSSPTETRRPTASDVFRPRLPLDPFTPQDNRQPHVERGPVMNPDTPWIAHDLASLSHAFTLGPNVLLVLGAPSPHALAPLLRSSTFDHSLLLLVTHSPPTRSSLVAAAGSSSNRHAAIRVLHLSEQLAPASPAFALALVAILEAAANVARAWRAQVVVSPPLPGSKPDIAQLGQASNGSFSIVEPLTDPGNPSPTLSNDYIQSPSKAKRGSTLAPVSSNNSPYPPGRLRPPSALSVASTTSNSVRSGFFFSSSTSLNKKTSSSRLSVQQPNSKRLSTSSKRMSSKAPINDGTRAFDALISFLPAAQPEKGVLKHVVLVSTLAASFLSGPSFATSPNASATTSYSYIGSLPGSRRGSVSSGMGPSRSASRAGSIIGGATESMANTKRPSSPSRSFFQTSKSMPGSPRGSLYGVASFAPRTSAHIVHILPASYRSAKLSNALGAFLESYSPSATSPSGARPPMKPQAYVVAERAISSTVDALESILVGALETEKSSIPDVKGKRREEGVRSGRWIASVVVEKDEESDGEDELDKTPFGLPTPPESRNGSGEDEGEPAVEQPQSRTPSHSPQTSPQSKKPRRASGQPAVFPVVEPPLLRSPSGRRRSDSAPTAQVKATQPSPIVIPKAPPSSFRSPATTRTWGSRGSRFFGGNTADDFKLSPKNRRGRSSPDLTELSKRKKRWWAFWS